VSRPPTSLDPIAPGIYGSREPLAFWLAPAEFARAHGKSERPRELERIVRAQRRQLAAEFPGVPVEVLEQ
jgi:hypothetical protein